MTEPGLPSGTQMVIFSLYCFYRWSFPWKMAEVFYFQFSKAFPSLETFRHQDTPVMLSE